MDVHIVSRLSPASSDSNEDEFFVDVKKGPWTAEEDALLVDYVSVHGEGRWNSVAQFAGLKRTGKSCRLRWLNYLRPDLRRGNITLQEQLLILELHSRWGNRWSKIAQYLPSRTDNEIKNYWRTRVQKQAKQLKCDVNSKQFRDTMQYVWIPRLKERIQSSLTNTSSGQPVNTENYIYDPTSDLRGGQVMNQAVHTGFDSSDPSFSPEINRAASSDSYSELTQASLASDPSELYDQWDTSVDINVIDGPCLWPENLLEQYPGSWIGEGDLMMENMWNDENIWFLQQQLFDY